MQIKEIWYDDICLRCRTRSEKIRAVEDGNGKIQSCKCARSKYFCWRVDSVMEKGDG